MASRSVGLKKRSGDMGRWRSYIRGPGAYCLPFVLPSETSPPGPLSVTERGDEVEPIEEIGCAVRTMNRSWCAEHNSTARRQARVPLSRPGGGRWERGQG